MNFENFAYWLQGYFELNRGNSLDEAQVSLIREHLQLCFEKKTSSLEEKKEVSRFVDSHDELNFIDKNEIISPLRAFC